MTINQAKGLKPGQRVIHIKTKTSGTIMRHVKDAVVIAWSDRVHQYVPYFRMNSIHVMAN